MADNVVEIEFFAKQNDLMAKLVQQQTGFQKSIDKLDKVSAAGKKSGDEIGSAFDKGAASLAKFAIGAVGVSLTLESLVSGAREFRKEADAGAQVFADMERKFAVQSGLRGTQSEAAQKRILGIAEKNAVMPDVANNAAVAMASGGFSAADASGDALDEFLKGSQATLKGQEDPTAMAQSVGQFMAAMKMDKNAKNVKRLMVASQQLFKETDFQLSDFTNLASKAQGLAGVASPEDVMATFNVMRSKTSADVASTSLKTFGERLQTAKGDPQAVSALRKLGLKPEDVDLTGEKIPQVLGRLGKGLDKLKPEQRPIELEKIFGKEALPGITGLIRDRFDLPAQYAAMGNVEQYEKDVAAATSGKSAGNVRLKVRKQRKLAEAGTDFSDTLLAAQNKRNEEGGWGWVTKARAGVAEGVAGAMEAIGASPEEAKASGVMAGFGGGADFYGRVLNELQESRKDAARQLKIQEEIARNTARPPIVIKEDPARRPKAAGAGLGAEFRK